MYKLYCTGCCAKAQKLNNKNAGRNIYFLFAIASFFQSIRIKEFGLNVFVSCKTADCLLPTVLVCSIQLQAITIFKSIVLR